MNTILVYPLRVKYLYFINYCYLILNTASNTALLIDPAWEMNIIEEKLEILGATLQGVLLTHSHLDHVNLASEFANKYSVPVYMSRDEIDYYYFQCPNLCALEDFTTFRVGEILITPLLTPGHTYGGTSYLIEENLFCGDTLFIEGCGICTGKGADPEIMFDTLQRLKSILQPQTLIYPGHCYGEPVGQPFNDIVNKNIYLQFDNKKGFVAFRMREHQKNAFKFR